MFLSRFSFVRFCLKLSSVLQYRILQYNNTWFCINPVFDIWCIMPAKKKSLMMHTQQQLLHFMIHRQELLDYIWIKRNWKDSEGVQLYASFWAMHKKIYMLIIHSYMYMKLMYKNIYLCNCYVKWCAFFWIHDSSCSRVLSRGGYDFAHNFAIIYIQLFFVGSQNKQKIPENISLQFKYKLLYKLCLYWTL